jgi:predicted DCC family thiol-disulfide oxidoreductase YuxK
MKKLTLFYDAKCGLCSQLRQWLAAQPAYVTLDFVPYDSAEAERLLPGLQYLRADEEIVVLADTGEVWQGAGAWVTCLWALQEYRAWSVRLASPTMQGLAKQVVHWISRHRIGLSRLLRFKSDADLAAAAQAEPLEQQCDWRAAATQAETSPHAAQAETSPARRQSHQGQLATAGSARWHDLDLID